MIRIRHCIRIGLDDFCYDYCLLFQDHWDPDSYAVDSRKKQRLTSVQLLGPLEGHAPAQRGPGGAHGAGVPRAGAALSGDAGDPLVVGCGVHLHPQLCINDSNEKSTAGKT